MGMVRPERRVNRLALLVGSNPLPNYLAAVILEPREVVLIYSPQTCIPRKHLEAALRERAPELEMSKEPICDATNAQEIRDVCKALDVDHLHYSGGTKPMAAHALQVCGLDDDQVSYLDERKACLRFADGFDIYLHQRELGLTLDRILGLHGVSRQQSKPDTGAPTDSDSDAIAAAVFRDPSHPSLLNKLRNVAVRGDGDGGKGRTVTDARCTPWDPKDEGLSLSVARVPDHDWTDNRWKNWCAFLKGGWLERWTAGRIGASMGRGSSEIDVGVDCQRTGQRPAQFEIDVALVRGHRLYVVSCTTERKKAQCKAKLFEVAMRARQMGGDLARSALVSLLAGRDEKGPYIEQLRSDIEGIWDAPNTPRAFGLDDLHEWAGVNAAPNLQLLENWLES